MVATAAVLFLGHFCGIEDWLYFGKLFAGGCYYLLLFRFILRGFLQGCLRLIECKFQIGCRAGEVVELCFRCVQLIRADAKSAGEKG